MSFPPARPVIAAVSGGSDSMALLVLLHAFFKSRSRGDIVAMTVDHGLRPESASEADRVGAFCASRDIPHRTLRWQGAKPSSGVPAAAREARHRLLAEAARSIDAAMVMTGHTANDQAETVAMRRERGSGRGLAGMAPATLYDGSVWFVRPLLAHPRAALRAMLVDAGISWIDDPSNEQAAYERVRARRALMGPDEGRVVATLLEQGRLAALERVNLATRAALLIRHHAVFATPGLLRVESGLLTVEDEPAARLAFRLLLSAVGGREHLPDASRARSLFELLASGPGRGSLGGAVVERRKGAFYLHRELRAGWTGSIPAVAGGIWDGRFRIAARSLPGNAVVECSGKTLASARARSSAGAAVPMALARAALAAEPVLHVRGAGTNLDPPGQNGDGGMLRRVVAPYARFLPSFDLAPAEALRTLLGGDCFPASPWDSHNAA
ncbi:tRNA lysidine(34) synthetase TilS [Aquibium sp. ELW1220]|nr:tRNA lysidine(34) synthetase TilS [Aquibium sp. ELW1220]MDN2579910.1 tRNA lysidine(34) synthetase TilS [Aquibium sp. ELW1220]